MKKIFVIFLIAFFSCQRERAAEVNPDFIGSWRHYDDPDDVHYIIIESNGQGFMEYYKDGQFDHDTQTRGWFIKNNKLVFGRITGKDESFHIDLMPTISTTRGIYITFLIM